MRAILMALGGALVLVACSSQKPAAKMDDSGLAKLNEAQMEPVDEARIEQGRAQDALSRARANEADARARLEVAKSEHAVSDAQLKRAQAERDLLKKQYADKDRMAAVDQEVAGAQEALRATDLKLQYLQQSIGVAESERRLAQAHLATTDALTERAKYQAMRAGNAPQAESINPGEVEKRFAEAQGQEAASRKEVAQRRTTASDLYNRWQQADAKARTVARPSTLTVPPPTGEPTTR
jgi:chromosome segregation ATPase